MTSEDATPSQVKYCPQCEGEFVLELETCPDCGVTLTTSPPVEPPHPEPVEVFSCVDRVVLPLARATLSDAGIEHEEIERDLSSAIMGSVKHETVILVGTDDAERATELLDAMDDGKPQLPY